MKKTNKIIKAQRNNQFVSDGVQEHIPQEAEDMLKENDAYISREDTNRILTLAETNFFVDKNNKLTYDLSKLGTNKEQTGLLIKAYGLYFEDNVKVFAINIPDDEEDPIDADLRLCLRLTIGVRNAKTAEIDGKETATIDVYLNDLQHESAIIKLMNIVYFFRNLHVSYNELRNCNSILDVIEQIRKFENELFSDNFMQYIKYQVMHAQTFVQYIMGAALDAEGFTNTELTYMYLYNGRPLFDDSTSILIENDPDMRASVVPRNVAFATTFGTESVDIEPYTNLFDLDVDGEEDIPTQIVIPLIDSITSTYNLSRLEMQIKHLAFLSILKRYKKHSIGDWDEKVMELLNIPNFFISAMMVENETGKVKDVTAVEATIFEE